jgi:glucan endo-1,3-alpha-glucosidase
LNIGADSWETSQVQNAYNAAQQLGTNFKLFLSLDFTSFPCNVGTVVSRINQFSSHPNQLKFNGKVFVSSFSGDCLGNSGWGSVKAQTNAYVMPFIWGLEGQFNNWLSLDSWFWYVQLLVLFLAPFLIGLFYPSWGCAWPQGNYAKDVGVLNQIVAFQLSNSNRQTTINTVKSRIVCCHFSPLIMILIDLGQLGNRYATALSGWV